MAKRLNEWESQSPGTKSTMLRALSHVRPSHLLDADLFDFEGLAPQGQDADVP